jgi:hypothetical protein
VDLRASGDKAFGQPHARNRCPGDRRFATGPGASGASAPAGGAAIGVALLRVSFGRALAGLRPPVGRARRGKRSAQRRATPGSHRAEHRPHCQTAASTQTTATRQPAHRAPAGQKLAADHQNSATQRRRAVRVVANRIVNYFTALALATSIDALRRNDADWLPCVVDLILQRSKTACAYSASSSSCSGVIS